MVAPFDCVCGAVENERNRDCAVNDIVATHTRRRTNERKSNENRKNILDMFYVCEKIEFFRSVCRNVVSGLALLFAPIPKANTYHLHWPSNHIVLVIFSMFDVFAPMLVG